MTIHMDSEHWSTLDCYSSEHKQNDLSIHITESQSLEEFQTKLNDYIAGHLIQCKFVHYTLSIIEV